MNVHGKNQYRIGSFGDHVVEFDLLLPSGEIVRCDRERHGDLFHAAIGGLACSGFFVQLKLRMLRAPTGLLDVGVASPASLDGSSNSSSVGRFRLLGRLDRCYATAAAWAAASFTAPASCGPTKSRTPPAR